MYGGVQAEKDALAPAPWGVGHGLLVERSGIDDRLCAPVAAEHDQEVRDHGRFTLLVELDNVFCRQAAKRHLDHAHRAVDDPGPGRNHRARPAGAAT